MNSHILQDCLGYVQYRRGTVLATTVETMVSGLIENNCHTDGNSDIVIDGNLTDGVT